MLGLCHVYNNIETVNSFREFGRFLENCFREIGLLCIFSVFGDSCFRGFGFSGIRVDLCWLGTELRKELNSNCYTPQFSACNSESKLSAQISDRSNDRSDSFRTIVQIVLERSFSGLRRMITYLQSTMGRNSRN